MKGKFFLSFVAGSLLFCGSRSLAATVVFSSLYPGGFYLNTGYVIEGSNNASGYQEVANRFVPTSGGILSSIELGLSYDGTPNQVDVSLRLDGLLGSPSPGVLFSQTVTTTFDIFSSNTNLLSVVPSSSIFLTPGTGYWIVVRPHTPDSVDVWKFGAVAGNSAYSTDAGQTWRTGGGEYNSLNAFRVSVVPEPATLSLVCVGLAGIAARRMAKKK
jgi:hypothetical protein